MQDDKRAPGTTECPYCGRTDRHTHRLFRRAFCEPPPQWRFYREGALAPADEATIREFSEQLRACSDMRGLAGMVMAQMWAEIDRLRDELVKARA